MVYLAWDRLRPSGLGTAYFIGEFAGIGSVYLMAWALTLATRMKWLEQWFGGLDCMYFQHRQYALWAMLLLTLHIVLLTPGEHADPRQDPQTVQTGDVLGVVSGVALLTLVIVSLARVGRILRLPYERWLLLHRFIGLLFLLTVVHGWILDRIIRGSTPSWPLTHSWAPSAWPHMVMRN